MSQVLPPEGPGGEAPGGEAPVFPKFHIAVVATLVGAGGTTYPSFSSSMMENGDPGKVTLSMIRKVCKISPKLFFTTDGKTRLADTTTLGYYMSLTPEGQEILNGEKKPPAPGVGNDNRNAGGNQGQQPAKPPGMVDTLTVRVTDGKTAEQLRNVPGRNAGMNELLDKIGGGGLARGNLPDLDQKLAALEMNLGAQASSKTYPEPADLTEGQWAKILANNRALHGFVYNEKLATLRKAPKPAFRICGANNIIQGDPVKPSKEGGNKEDKKHQDKDDSKEDDNSDGSALQKILPPIPPFYVDDDASVEVIEIAAALQQTMVKEGFSSWAIDANIGGGPMKAAGNISGAYENEHSSVKQDRSKISVDSLAVTYNFPRVVIELEPDCLELTPQCRQDAENVVDEASKKKFFAKYGSVFASKFTLGGRLSSTRHLKKEELSSLDQVKDKSRLAAGLSLQSPKVSGVGNFAKVDSEGKDEGNASIFQNLRLTWNARGGNTTLCSNPPLWCSSVRDYSLWRLMDQSLVLDMESLIKDVDTAAHYWLAHPTPKSGRTGRGGESGGGNGGNQGIGNEGLVNEDIRNMLVYAFDDEGKSNVARAVKDYYVNEEFYLSVHIAKFNDFLKNKMPNDHDASKIAAGTKWGALELDQKIGFALWMAYQNLVKLN